MTVKRYQASNTMLFFAKEKDRPIMSDLDFLLTIKLINVWITENSGKITGYTEICCRYVTNPRCLTMIDYTSTI